jgi:hypothetical protein
MLYLQPDIKTVFRIDFSANSNCMEHSPSWESDNSSGAEEKSCLLWDPKVLHSDYKSPLQEYIVNTIHIHIPLRSVITLTFYPYPELQNVHSLQTVELKISMRFPFLPYLLCIHLVLLGLITQITSCEGYKLWDSALRIFIRTPVTTSFLGQNISLTALFSAPSTIQFLPLWKVSLSLQSLSNEYDTQGVSYLCWPLHCSALHGDQCTAGCEAHTNFADESACLTADNVRNEVVTIHRSQEVLKMLSFYT